MPAMARHPAYLRRLKITRVEAGGRVPVEEGERPNAVTAAAVNAAAYPESEAVRPSPIAQGMRHLGIHARARESAPSPTSAPPPPLRI